MIKKILLSILLILLCLACKDDDDKATIVLEEETERGAFLRTLQINNKEFDINDTSSTFSILFQEQDLEDGDLLETVKVYVSFLDNTPVNNSSQTNEVLFKTYDASDFTPGAFSLPTMGIEYTFEELLTATNKALIDVECKDQFLLRFELQLTNGLVFSSSNASACILGYDTEFASPFLYTVTVVEALDRELFTGMYLYESILDGPFGPTFDESFIVEVTPGHSNNVRNVTFDNFPSRPPRIYRFSLACDEVIFEKNQLRYNTLNSPCGENGQPILLGPDSVNAPINPDDDSVFELWFVEGYLGFDGDFGFGTVPSRIRLSKQ